jgi:hypothetical protein
MTDEVYLNHIDEMKMKAIWDLAPCSVIAL